MPSLISPKILPKRAKNTSNSPLNYLHPGSKTGQTRIQHMKNIKRKNQKNMPEKGENHPCFWYSSGGDRGFGCVYAKNNSTQPIQARQISAQSSQFKRNSTQLNSTQRSSAQLSKFQLNSAKQVSTQLRLSVSP